MSNPSTARFGWLLNRNKGKQKALLPDEHGVRLVDDSFQPQEGGVLSTKDSYILYPDPVVSGTLGKDTIPSGPLFPRPVRVSSVFERQQRPRWIGPEAEEDERSLGRASPEPQFSTPPLSPSGPSSSSSSSVAPSELTFTAPQPPSIPTPPSPLAIDPDAPPAFTPFELHTRQLIRTAMDQLGHAHDAEVAAVTASRRRHKPALTIQTMSTPHSPTTPRPVSPFQPPLPFAEQSYAATGELLWHLRQHLDGELRRVRVEETSRRESEVYGVRLELSGENERRRNADGWRRWAERDKAEAIAELVELRAAHEEATRLLNTERTAHDEARTAQERADQASIVERQESSRALTIAEQARAGLAINVVDLERHLGSSKDSCSLLQLQLVDLQEQHATLQSRFEVSQRMTRDAHRQARACRERQMAARAQLEHDKHSAQQAHIAAAARSIRVERQLNKATFEIDILRAHISASSASGEDNQELTARIEAVTEAVSCPVCFDPLDRPTTLPCGHSGCTECIQACLCADSQRRCPTCREPTPANWRAGRSFALESAVEAVKKAGGA